MADLDLDELERLHKRWLHCAFSEDPVCRAMEEALADGLPSLIASARRLAELEPLIAEWKAADEDMAPVFAIAQAMPDAMRRIAQLQTERDDAVRRLAEVEAHGCHNCGNPGPCDGIYVAPNGGVGCLGWRART